MTNPPGAEARGGLGWQTALQRHARWERSALAELLPATSAVQADLLALDFAGVAGDETSAAQFGLQGSVEIDQGAGHTVTDGTGLTGFATTVDVDLDVERFSVVGQHQGLLDHHDGGLTAEVLLNGLAVDDDMAGALLDEDAGGGRLATAGAVVPVTNHVAAPQISRALGCCAACGCSLPA